ncbi:hypothetical protein FH174_09465 [Staphylococcus cohnii]|uniref:hypothetical protein n=1 Tax=Staphylococcus cohnii TaxID=29382 RepID=UPI001F56F086|nr:hypothetical protein [Staphylococcus cohnii]MCI2941733.1 hypothetical protein [Staphylococcus cohnii]
MAYEYEGKLLDYASHNKTYEEYKAMSQELQEVYRKAKAWEYLKEEMRSMFVWGYDLPKSTPSKYMNEAYGIVFKTMCELDGTNEFSNLLSDLGDE